MEIDLAAPENMYKQEKVQKVLDDPVVAMSTSYVIQNKKILGFKNASRSFSLFIVILTMKYYKLTQDL